MSKLEELIERLCLGEVEYKTIGEVCDLITDYVAAGSFEDLRKKVKYCDTPDFAQLVRTTDIKSKFTNKTFVYVSESAFKFLWRVNLDKELLILPNIGNCGEVYHIIPDGLPYSNNVLGPNAILVRSENYNNRFLYHLFQTPGFQTQLYKITSQTGQSKFNKTDLKKLIIPVPPLEVQQEIVRILDNFTELIAEITTELTARKQQYEHYNNKLLSLERYPYMQLSQICEIVDYRGKTPKKVENGIYLVTAKNIKKGYIDYEASKEYVSYEDYNVVMRRGFPKLGDVLITTEAPCGNVAQVNKENIALAQRVIKYRPNEVIMLSSFLKFILLGKEFQDKLALSSTGGTVKGIKGSKLHKLTVPVPPLDEQARIVSILDRFDTLVNDIKQGLPAEIAARQKQYEYYRDKLLTFKEVGDESI